MAKRFTDTDKWKREWFYELKPHAKLAWLYLLDQCDHCGIWPRNFRLMSEQLGVKIDHDLLGEWFGSKITNFDGDKYFIPSFFEFQYGSSKDGFKAKQSALSTLCKLGLADSEGNIINSKEESNNTSEQSVDCLSIGKSIGIIKSKSKKGSVRGNFETEINAIYSNFYPRKEGKGKGVESAIKQLKTEADLLAFETAVIRYKDHCAKNGTEPKYIKHFSSFVTSWREWLDPETGTADSPKNAVDAEMAALAQMIEEGA